MRDRVRGVVMARRSVRAVDSSDAGAHELRPVAGDVAQPQDRTAADGAAFHIDEGLGLAARGQAEALAALLQGIERGLHGGGVAGGSQVPKASARLAVAPSPAIEGSPSNAVRRRARAS